MYVNGWEEREDCTCVDIPQDRPVRVRVSLTLTLALTLPLTLTLTLALALALTLTRCASRSGSTEARLYYPLGALLPLRRAQAGGAKVGRGGGGDLGGGRAGAVRQVA